MAWISVLASVLLLYAVCSSETQQVIGRGDLVGAWKNADGDLLRFYADHEVKADALAETGSGGRECEGRGVGDWSFYFATDDSGELLMTSDEASEGSLISVRLPGNDEGECQVDLSVIDGGRSLCVADLDNVCATGARFTRQ
ncbi:MULTISPECIES: hypothetical protein [unclassified Streptomyces]|uniref:hypothetical protein n=1 Tax=unclassified Streptomyces TaxID=2593676 RepID=UPI000B50A586|nr:MULTISPECIES: hypothetical protein [unclassified Streptomyces]MYX02075.1 hypothetical protein [Streptomyces sp. SID8378]SNB60222.1 hypothetical protein SAMN02745831_00199 [Streptomyces sp. PgraA7]